jgi:anti-sigma B factor antagonist
MTELQVKQTGAQAIIILTEKLTASEVPNLKSELKRLIDAQIPSLTLDCTRLSIMDSTGIGCLVAAYNSLDKIDGKLYMIQVSSDMYDLLCSMRLDRRIKITPLLAE